MVRSSHLVFELKSVGEGLFLRWAEGKLVWFSGFSPHLPVPEPANTVSVPQPGASGAFSHTRQRNLRDLTYPEKQQSVFTMARRRPYLASQ